MKFESTGIDVIYLLSLPILEAWIEVLHKLAFNSFILGSLPILEAWIEVSFTLTNFGVVVWSLPILEAWIEVPNP